MRVDDVVGNICQALPCSGCNTRGGWQQEAGKVGAEGGTSRGEEETEPAPEEEEEKRGEEGKESTPRQAA
jgi:hypothetical protein